MIQARNRLNRNLKMRFLSRSKKQVDCALEKFNVVGQMNSDLRRLDTRQWIVGQTKRTAVVSRCEIIYLLEKNNLLDYMKFHLGPLNFRTHRARSVKPARCSTKSLYSPNAQTSEDASGAVVSVLNL